VLVLKTLQLGIRGSFENFTTVIVLKTLQLGRGSSFGKFPYNMRGNKHLPIIFKSYTSNAFFFQNQVTEKKRKQKLAHNLGVQEKKTKVTEHLGEKNKSGDAKRGRSWPLWKENKSWNANKNQNPW
jgi:hypothetical protein